MIDTLVFMIVLCGDA